MGQSVVRFGELKAESFVQGTNNNWLIYSALPYSKQHSSGLDGDVVIAATPTIEIIDADLDVAIPEQYEYAYSIGIDNKVKIAFSKEKHENKGSAADALKCISVIYEIGNLTTNGSNYILTVRNSMGEEIHRSTPLTMTQIQTVITTFDDTREIERGGFLKYEIMRDYSV